MLKCVRVDRLPDDLMVTHIKIPHISWIKDEDGT